MARTRSQTKNSTQIVESIETAVSEPLKPARVTRSRAKKQASSEPPETHPSAPAPPKTTQRTIKKPTKPSARKRPGKTAASRGKRTSTKSTSPEDNEEPIEEQQPVSEVPTEAQIETAAEPKLPSPKAVETAKPKGRKGAKKTKKRSRVEHSDDEEEHALGTPAAKRRNLGPAGSTPFAGRRLSPASRLISSRAKPLSERLRRRTVESEGRLYTTLFRLPELVAQVEADRRASANGSETPDFEAPCEPMAHPIDQADLEDQENQVAAVTSESDLPQTPQRGWNIRGLFNSVPRSFSRYIPGFGRSPEKDEDTTVLQPASERLNRTNASTRTVATPLDFENGHQPVVKPKPKAPSPHNLTYSLFPARYDRAKYLSFDNVPYKAPSTSATAEPSDQTTSTATEMTLAGEAQPVSNGEAQGVLAAAAQSEAIGETTKTTDVERQPTIVNKSNVPPQTPGNQESKKRKRLPSPDVIPNPPGTSYGMDLRYFCYSDSEEEDEEMSAPVVPPPTAIKPSLRNALRAERPLAKKVRFDASPEDTPSKARLRDRATDPYHGRQFLSPGETSSAPVPAEPVPATPTPVVQRPPGFIPNTQGTFCLNYDDFSDDTDPSDISMTSAPSPSLTSEASSPLRPNGFLDTPTRPNALSAEPTKPAEVAPSPPPRPTPRHAALPPSTPAKVDETALAKVRSQAEKYKPKTPSGLRTASRYSSPLVAPSPASPGTIVAEQPNLDFGGDDEFARDAQWLYLNCPSGDFDKLQWPSKESLTSGLDAQPEVKLYLDKLWTGPVADRDATSFRHALNAFKPEPALV
ncbi:hypothetical protein ASPZODRAFT_18539 [Penicilliopsis zonata CBS 506.65]|uniref:Uncharacterized protein n=1 Tax=Penicilliopsis zonata CBS 506.65 TaxID=1073090 RepID=A0A1L9SB37_9EURO|nr:hypothetical protein ASPZODRAFT_18539 [Penicilliopsis zonata CBS 506.65]OJJ44337.1 hypothetical protein ASPZODRAFT_18539 [Penicilliopsis zonata CBS 506.65]